MNQQEIIKWLLEGDVAIQHQVHRDLLSADRKDLQKRIATEGWGALFLAKRKAAGHWGQAFYQPKWISSHYTLMDLRNLCIAPDNPLIQASIHQILQTEKGGKGNCILPIGKDRVCDMCINGMFLNYATYFQTAENKLESVVDFILSQRMPDGGFNCRLNRSGAKHSSMHTTISTLEGIVEYENNGYQYRLAELQKTKRSCVEFLLMHQLYRSDRTGAIIHKDFLRLAYPSRWKYDILRALDCFQLGKIPWDDRFQPAMDVLFKKRNKDGTWNVQAKHPGQIHFEMEKAGKPSRWNTLRALRVLKHFGKW